MHTKIKSRYQQSLAEVKPEIASQWHPTKNGNLTPYDVSPGMRKEVWWVCKKGHAYQMYINKRNAARSQCNVCSGTVINEYNSLGSLRPDLAAEWDFKNNGDLTPDQFVTGSLREVHWVCKKKAHKFKAKIKHRANAADCIYCSGKKVCDDNSLEALHPDIAKQWHPTKNGKLTPNDVLPKSNRKAFWLCEKGHDWDTAVYARHETGCPHCLKEKGTSFAEQAIFYYVKQIFENAENRKILKEIHNKLEVDIFVPTFNFAIEYDGEYFHRGKPEKEKTKNAKLKKHRIKLIRVREEGLQKLQNDDDEYAEIIHRSSDKRDLNRCITLIFDRVKDTCELSEEQVSKIDSTLVDIERDGVCIQELYMLTEKENSFIHFYPHLLPSWDQEKNGNIKPEYVSRFKEVYWKCDKNHSWKEDASQRVKRKQCPYCIKKWVSEENNFMKTHPEIAKEWDYKKNKIKPEEVTEISGLVVHWICPVNPDHSWKAKVSSRARGQNCSICANRIVDPTNSLATLRPDIAKLWHITKNKELTPHDVTAGSNTKVYWLCEKGHETQAQVKERVEGKKCIYCKNLKVTEDNSLANIRPVLALQWHPTKNGDLKPDMVTTGSGKRVWWECEKCEHEWDAFIHNRVRWSQCPWCKK